MEGPAISPQEVPNEPATLCKTCQEAHHEALRDDETNKWKEVNHGGIPRIMLQYRTSLRSLFTDMWPGLPRLLNSAKSGCGFCALVREAILSNESRDAWLGLIEGGLTEDTPSQLDMSFTYLSEHRYIGLAYLELTVVHVMTDLKIQLRFQLEANPGQLLSKVISCTSCSC